MTISRSLFVVGLAFLWSYAEAQNINSSPTGVKQQVLLLNFANNGQHLVASVGEQIEITLGTVGPQKYGTPQLSSSAIRLESTALDSRDRPIPNPGGLMFVYLFEAAAEGEARVQVPIISDDPDSTKKLTFTATIQIGRADKKSMALQASMLPDQVNSEPWNNAWTRLDSGVLQQSFVPSLSMLTAVEVELVAAVPGAQDDEVTMTLLNAAERTLAIVSKTVPVAQCDHVLFVLPHGGFPVSPRQVYGIRVRGGNVFGWKYVEGGYATNAGSLNGNPLLSNTRSTFLFRTFGAN